MYSDYELQQDLEFRKAAHIHRTIIKALVCYNTTIHPEWSDTQSLDSAVELFEFALRTKSKQGIDRLYNDSYQMLKRLALLD